MRKPKNLKLSRETLYILETADLTKLAAGSASTGVLMCPTVSGRIVCFRCT